MRIRWLQKQTQTLIEQNEQELKEQTLRIKNRMNSYVKECIRMLRTELTKNFKLLYTELDYIRHEDEKN